MRNPPEYEFQTRAEKTCTEHNRKNRVWPPQNLSAKRKSDLQKIKGITALGKKPMEKATGMFESSTNR